MNLLFLGSWGIRRAHLYSVPQITEYLTFISLFGYTICETFYKRRNNITVDHDPLHPCVEQINFSFLLFWNIHYFDIDWFFLNRDLLVPKTLVFSNVFNVLSANGRKIPESGPKRARVKGVLYADCKDFKILIVWECVTSVRVMVCSVPLFQV